MKPKTASKPLPEIVRVTEIGSDTDRLRFAVQLAQTDLDTLRPGDWLNLQWTLRDFLHPLHHDMASGGLHVSPVDPPAPEAYSREDFRALQAETLQLLAIAIDGIPQDPAWNPPRVQMRLMPVPLLTPPEGKERRHFLVAEGSTRDMFILRLAHLLSAREVPKLFRCPECDTIFFRRKNQAYCGRACVNRVTQRRWRERHLIPVGQVTEADTAQAVATVHGEKGGQASAPSVASAQSLVAVSS